MRESDRGLRLLLLASVFTIATCGLVYELIAGTIASCLLGDSVLQFSTVIGVYLFAMGHADWCQLVAADLACVHPGIERHIRNIDVWLWGHGMIRPVPRTAASSLHIQT